MEFKVELSPCAERDIAVAFDYIRVDSPGNAVKWRRRLEEKLRILERMPHSFGTAPEDNDAQADVRQLIFGQYRVLYTVREQTVFILTIRHGARRFLTDEQIDSIE